ncbi:hypothetical protein EZV62_018895 [Acer yangbiense]|uniref:Uncharacterized protein n=1 Tax=Acer yangbiense TaxID=1000413 RepID=A0A5C7HA37_9ROSI|nr:hypothetical protein EZV62_018895 [Acer yangbiense]
MDTKRLVIYHGGSWVGNSYEGGLTKWVHVPRGLTYDALVKLVQDVAKVDVASHGDVGFRSCQIKDVFEPPFNPQLLCLEVEEATSFSLSSRYLSNVSKKALNAIV